MKQGPNSQQSWCCAEYRSHDYCQVTQLVAAAAADDHPFERAGSERQPKNNPPHLADFTGQVSLPPVSALVAKQRVALAGCASSERSAESPKVDKVVRDGAPRFPVPVCPATGD
jgi:hypothetical protein